MAAVAAVATVAAVAIVAFFSTLKFLLKIRKDRSGGIGYRFFKKYFFVVFKYIGTTYKRRIDEVNRLNALYIDLLPEKKSIQKCYKYICEKEHYRMLKDWPYEQDLENIASDVVQTLSQEISKKKGKKMSRKKRTEKRNEVFFI